MVIIFALLVHSGCRGRPEGLEQCLPGRVYKRERKGSVGMYRGIAISKSHGFSMVRAQERRERS